MLHLRSHGDERQILEDEPEAVRRQTEYYAPE